MDNNSSINFNDLQLLLDSKWNYFYPIYCSDEIFAHSSSFHTFFSHNFCILSIFLSYFSSRYIYKNQGNFRYVISRSMVLKISYERMIKTFVKDSVKNDHEGRYLPAFCYKFSPFTEIRYPRFIFGPPYRSQRRPATCCSILSPACWALPFCQLARFRGLPFDHSSQHECGRPTEAAFSIPLSSTPIFFLPSLSSNALFLPRRINDFWGGTETFVTIFSLA